MKSNAGYSCNIGYEYCGFGFGTLFCSEDKSEYNCSVSLCVVLVYVLEIESDCRVLCLVGLFSRQSLVGLPIFKAKSDRPFFKAKSGRPAYFQGKVW